MVLSHTIEFVGVGFPNPLGKETSPLRWMTHLAILVCSRLSLQRSDMSIAARHTNVLKPQRGDMSHLSPIAVFDRLKTEAPPHGCMRRGWVPQPVWTRKPSQYDASRTLNFGVLVPFAPEERYVRFVSITDQYGFGEGG